MTGVDTNLVVYAHRADADWHPQAAASITGPRMHDARIATFCLHHAVRELWTADRDFSMFPALHVHNPLVV